METQSQPEAERLRAVFDAFPAMVFVLDREGRILDANLAALATMGDGTAVFLSRLCGEALHCAHERESPDGCGTTESCPACVLRCAVGRAWQGAPVARRDGKMTIREADADREVRVLVTTTRLQYGETEAVLLILENVTPAA